MPPAVIQRVVRQRYGRFRLCYESGLKTNPDLRGRVTVHFLIDGKGQTKGPAVVAGKTTLPDNKVATCVANAFRRLSFPQPEQGTVTVSYPIIFSPAS